MPLTFPYPKPAALPRFDLGATVASGIKAYAGGGTQAAVGAVASSVGGAIGGPIGGLIGGVLGGGKIDPGAIGAAVGTLILPGIGTLIGGAVGSLIPMDTKSKANWRRTLGRVYRAAILGHVPTIDANAIPVLQKLVKLWLDAGDASGAQFWDKVVAVFRVPTEKGGTKKGFGSGAPLGSKDAEKVAGFSQGLTAFLNAIGV